MRSLLAFAAAVLVFPVVASPARAGECFGMLNYTYEAGACTDTTGDTTNLLIASGKESEELQQGMIERSRSILVGGGGYGRTGPRGIDEGLYRRVARTMVVKYNGPTIMPPLLVERIRVTDPKKYAELVKYFNAEIAEYDASPQALERFDGWNYLPGARAAFVESLYMVFDGELASGDQNTLLMQALGHVMISAPVAGYSEFVREAIREDYVVRAFSFFDAAEYLVHHRRKTELALLRHQARAALIRDLSVDPRNVRMNDIFCNTMTTRAVSCDMERRFFLGHR